MGSPARIPQSVHFGDYVLDLQTAELRRNGNRITLQDQPFQILSMLLENPGQLVTREELIRRLWHSGTFVDFEQSLNKAVGRLREALGDNADQPHFVETLPRRGYRWIGPLHSSTAQLIDTTRLDPRDSVDSTAPAAFLPPRPTWQHPLFLGLASLVLLASLAAWLIYGRTNRPVDTAPIRSLAVLPLENLSGDPAQEPFADAVTDQLITDLGRIDSLRVISRTSVMQYKRVHRPLPQIARDLRVDAIVEGSVIRSGDEIRITAQLIQADTDKHLWADTYRGDVRDVLGLQERVAESIADRVRLRLGGTGQSIPGTTRSIDPGAFEDYLDGVSQTSTADGSQTAIRYFNSAIIKQPDFAEAYTERARTYSELGHMLVLPPDESFRKAKSDSLKAIEIDDRLADAHAILGQMYLLYDWNFTAAETELQRALQLNPNNVSARGRYAELLVATGQNEEALAEIRRRLEIDPIPAQRNAILAPFLFFTRHYDDVIVNTRNVVAVNPNSFGAHLWLGLSLEQKRQFPLALTELRRAVELSNNKSWIAFVAHDLALSGDRKGALRILREMQAPSKQNYVSPWWQAIVYAGLGDKEQAMFWLEKSYRGREHDLVFSDCWPMFDILRNDNRFEDLRHRIGLPQRAP